MFEPRPLGEGSGIQSLIDHYRTNGESEYVARIEAALTDHPQDAGEIARAADVSYNSARKGLEDLAVEGRAERLVKQLPPKPFKRTQWRIRWQLPSVTK
jgi:predicted ArsR family transcriptional regulator